MSGMSHALAVVSPRQGQAPTADEPHKLLIQDPACCTEEFLIAVCKAQKNKVLSSTNGAV